MTQPYAYPAPPGQGGGPQFQPPQVQPPQFYPPTSPTGYPVPPISPGTGVPGPAPSLFLQRPAVVAMSATMTVTASLQWICVLSFAWLLATAGASNLALEGSEGSLFHFLNRFHYSMVDGLAWPLYGFPLLSFFLGFVVLAPRPWARWSLTLTGLAALGWSAWWLQDHLIWWLAPALYVIVACLVLWTPGASQWYRQRGRIN